MICVAWAFHWKRELRQTNEIVTSGGSKYRDENCKNLIGNSVWGQREGHTIFNTLNYSKGRKGKTKQNGCPFSYISAPLWIAGRDVVNLSRDVVDKLCKNRAPWCMNVEILALQKREGPSYHVTSFSRIFWGLDCMEWWQARGPIATWKVPMFWSHGFNQHRVGDFYSCIWWRRCSFSWTWKTGHSLLQMDALLNIGAALWFVCLWVDGVWFACIFFGFGDDDVSVHPLLQFEKVSPQKIGCGKLFRTQARVNWRSKYGRHWNWNVMRTKNNQQKSHRSNHFVVFLSV